MTTSLADQYPLDAMNSQIRPTCAVEARPRLRGLVLLAGSVRPSDLSRSIGRSLLDLPVDEGVSVLQHWEEQGRSLANLAGSDSLPVRVVLDRGGAEPKRNGGGGPIRVTLERETNEFRGTGGVLRDLSVGYESDDILLVASAGQIMVESLSDLATDLLANDSECVLVGHDDGTPGGIFAVTCSVLRGIREVGFLDFKEQVLPRLAASGHRVRVVQRRSATGYGVRTLGGYLAGLRAYHRVKAGKRVSADPFAEHWSPTFAVVEQGASVDPGATIHDSVVLDGGIVERGAVVVRSVVCPGGIVKAGETAAEKIVAPERVLRMSR